MVCPQRFSRTARRERGVKSGTGAMVEKIEFSPTGFSCDFLRGVFVRFRHVLHITFLFVVDLIFPLLK